MVLTLVTTSQVSWYHIFETSWRYYQMCTKLHSDYYSILSCIVTRRVSIFYDSGLWREITNVSDCCALFSVRFEKIISSQKESAMILREHSDTYLRTIRIHSCNEIFNFNKKLSQIFLNHVCSFYYRVASSISTRNQMSSKKESSMILRTASFILQ